jgi:hypothetical protein
MNNRTLAFFITILLSGSVIISCSPKSESGDTVPPEIVAQSPVNDAIDVPISNITGGFEVSVTFSKSVIGAQGSSTAFTLKKLGMYENVPASVTYDAALKKATLTTSAPLDPDTFYLVTLTDDIKSRSGVPLAPVPWGFTTGVSADTTPPTVTVKTPGAGDNYVNVSSNIDVTFSEQVQPTTIGNSTFFLKNNETQAVISALVTYNDAAFKATLNPVVLELDDFTTYEVTLTTDIKDLAGNNLENDIIWTFITDDTHNPTVESKSPDSGATGVSTNTSITVVFTEKLKDYTIHNTTTNFVLYKGIDQVASTVVYNDLTRTATLTPIAILDPGTIYTVTLTDGIKDRAHLPLAPAPYSWTFTTGAAVDTDPPTIVYQNITDNQTNIPITTSVLVKFSELVNGINSSYFTLKKLDNTPVAAQSITFNSSTKEATFQPAASLTEGTGYRVTLTGDITDNAGNHLVEYSWTFITADNTKPVVTSKNPGAVGNVAVNSNVSVIFSESVTGVGTSTFTLERSSDELLISAGIVYNDITKTATLTPDVPLDYSTQYTVTLSSGIKDNFNNSLNQVIWDFTTGIMPDTTPPAITGTSPAADATGVSLNADITATFSEDITGADSSSIILKQGATQLPALITYDALSKTVTINPNASLSYSTTYSVTVAGAPSTTIMDNALNKFAADYTWSFTTVADITPPIVTGETPALNATNIPINGATVKAIFSESVTGVSTSTFTLRKRGAGSDTSATVLYDSGTKTATLTPSVVLDGSSIYDITLTGGIKDTANNSLSPDPTTWSFTTTIADITPPTVSTQSPLNGATSVSLNTTVSATFSEDVTGVSGTSFTLKRTSDSNPVSAAVTYVSGSKTATLVPDTSLEYNTQYTATLTAAIKDNSNNPLSQVTWSFTTGVDTTPPAVTAKSPANGATNVPINANITATFSEAVTGYSGSSFYLSPSISATVSYDSGTKTATLNPDSDLSGDTLYTVYLTAVITDSATPTPNALLPVSWTFTTQHVTDMTPPTITGRSPLSGATGVSLNGNITVTFSESVTGVNGSRFYLKQGTNTIAAEVTYDDVSRTATLNPTDDLAGNTVYSVTVKGGSTGVKDLASNPLAADDTWSFTTAADTTAPTVVGSPYPVKGSTGVPLKPYVTVTFSERVTGVSSSTFTLWQGATQITSYVLYDDASRTATLIPNANLSNTTEYIIRLTATGITDLASPANQLATGYWSDSTWTFTTATLPTIVTTTPADNASGVLVTTSSVIIQFNRTMNTAKGTAIITMNFNRNGTRSNGSSTITALAQTSDMYIGMLITGTGIPANSYITSIDSSSQIHISNNATSGGTSSITFYSGACGASLGNPIWSTSMYANDTITYTVFGELLASTVYSVTLFNWNGTFEDTMGNTLDPSVLTNKTLDFTTQSLAGGAPTISSSSPTGTGINRYIPRISVTFSQEMNTTAGSAAITGPITIIDREWSSDFKTVTFKIPDANIPLAASTAYTVTLTGFTGRNGQALSGNTCTFTTGTSVSVTNILVENFDTYSAPNFTNFGNSTGDNQDWTRIDYGRDPFVFPPTGTGYMAKACDWQWSAGDTAILNQIGTSSFPSGGEYILSFQMYHENQYDANDRTQIFVSTDGGVSWVQIANDIYRYDSTFTGRVKVTSFDPTSYTSNTGIVVVPNGTDLSQVVAGDTFVDASAIRFPILGDVNNTTHQFRIGTTQTVNVNAGATIVTQWMTHYKTLTGYAGQTSMKILLNTISAGETGNNIYIDNFKIVRYQ